jgi:hypothetical protein
MARVSNVITGWSPRTLAPCAIDFIVPWNFKHINNPFMQQQIRTVIVDMGYAMPEICSPEELLEATNE